ncbi:MAG: WcaI family glycosyltransferase [Mariprofundaceae bacterium]|nr:WcaI family glycosyltransferase [Mariprofundaceae bacterium]
MKILLYSINYAPEIISGGKYNSEMAEWLVCQGHDVRVVTAQPFYPQWKVFSGYNSMTYTKDSINGVNVLRCPLYVPKHPTGFKRILHFASFAFSSFPMMLGAIFWKPDLVFVVVPSLFSAPVAWLTARLSGGAQCWIHIQDFEVDAAFQLGLLQGHSLKRCVVWVERMLLQRFDVTSTISSTMLKRLHKKGIEFPVLFPNWSDLSKMQVDKAGGIRMRSMLGLNKHQTLCLYSGNIAEKQGLDILLDVAPKLPECKFVVCGDGASKYDLQHQAEEMNINNIVFIPLQPIEKLAALLSAANIHLVIQKHAVADLVMPSKLTNILAIGGAAIVTAGEYTELGQLGEADEPCVLRCEPESPDALHQAISRFISSPDLMRNIKRNAKKYANIHLDKEKILSNVMNNMDKLQRS